MEQSWGTSPERRGHRTRRRIRSLDATHAADYAPRHRHRREFRPAQTAHIMADCREAAEGRRAELRGILLRVYRLVREPPLHAHVDQALQLVLLGRRRLREEEVEHLLPVGVVLNLHVPLDGGPDAVDPVLREEGQRAEMTREPRHLLLRADHAGALNLLEPRDFLQ